MTTPLEALQDAQGKLTLAQTDLTAAQGLVTTAQADVATAIQGLTPPPTTAFMPALNSGTDLTNDVPAAAKLGARVVRVEWDISSPVSKLEPVIAAYAKVGIRVAPVAGFAGRIPTATEAANLANWTKAFGPEGTFWKNRQDYRLAIRTIEFGNETSYGYQYGDGVEKQSYKDRARLYARRAKEAAQAIGTGGPIGLLVQADDGGSGSSTWVDEMYAAVPSLHEFIAGWTVHPYGPQGPDKISRLISNTAKHGAPATMPIDVTEWGTSSDNGRTLSENYGWPKNLTYDQAAALLAKEVVAIRAVCGPRLVLFALYQVRDQKATGTTTGREAYFGAVQHEGQPKGAYTDRVKALLASTD